MEKKPRKKREPKRYSKPFQVHAEILKLKRSEKEKMSIACAMEAEALEKIRVANLPETDRAKSSHLIWEMERIREKSAKLFNAAEIIRDTKIPKLVQTLQQLNTVPMPFLDDTSVLRVK